jgi:Mor family transcriptional regulator
MQTGNEDYETIQELIGAEGARKLAKAFGGSNIYIPKNVIADEAQAEIRKAYKEGKSYRELSVKYGYSVAHIRYIIHRKK